MPRDRRRPARRAGRAACRPARARGCGRASASTLGKEAVEQAAASTSSRVSSVRSVPPISFEPRPGITTGARGRVGVARAAAPWPRAAGVGERRASAPRRAAVPLGLELAARRGGRARGPCCRRRAGCGRRRRRARAPARRRSSRTAISEKSVVPPPTSTTRTTSPTLTCLRQRVAAAARASCRARPAAPRAASAWPSPAGARLPRSARARAGSNDAGTVTVTACCGERRVRDARASQALAQVREVAHATPSSGETLGDLGRRIRGRIAARRSTPGWHSQLFALDTRRSGALAPRARRLRRPTQSRRVLGQGRASAPGAQLVRVRQVQERRQQRRASTCPGAISCGTSAARAGRRPRRPLGAARSTHDERAVRGAEVDADARTRRAHSSTSAGAITLHVVAFAQLRQLDA